MSTSEQIKEMVKEKYGAIAKQSKSRNQSSCCGSSCGCSSADASVMSEDYSKLPGYVPDADLALGCGLPTQFAGMKAGDTVVDLGAGAGNDAFIARDAVGPTGHVIGVDMTEPMVAKARTNAATLGYNNVEFRLGEIERLPINDNTVDVVVSNCVMNLVPDKNKAFAETYRIIKPGGHFSISDIVLEGELPEDLRHEAELYAGCVAGALQKSEYLDAIRNAGFVNVTIQKERAVDIPDEIRARQRALELQGDYRTSKLGIFSITVFGEKAK